MFDDRVLHYNQQYHYFESEQPVSNPIFEGGCFLFVVLGMIYVLYAYFIQPRGSPLDTNHVTGTEPWARNYIYPNHWRAGTITGVSEKTSLRQHKLTPHPTAPATPIFSCTIITYIIIYWVILICLSWVWGLLFMPPPTPTATTTVVILPTSTTTYSPAKAVTKSFIRPQYGTGIGWLTPTTTYSRIPPEKLPVFY
ncbi:hypothetical protein G9A89_011640 [Geosiphon pyriformis]|nr:hypothetical protein G9A89_011640 [Geosiphon pyriformis]